MIIEMHTPEPPLENDVLTYVHFENYQPEHSQERLVPDGSVFLVIELDGITRQLLDNETLLPKKDFTQAWVSGAQRSFLSISVHDDSEMFVIQFKPGGAYSYFEAPITELTNLVVMAREVLGEGVVTLRSKLLAAGDSAAKFAVASEYLSARRDQVGRLAKPVVRQLVELIQANATSKIEELIVDCGLSHKQLIHVFKNEVGLTPKAFQRIARFHDVLPLIKDEEEVSWAQLSADCGYFDQAHFIKEFKAFSGFNPQKFLTDHEHDDRLNFFPLD